MSKVLLHLKRAPSKPPQPRRLPGTSPRFCLCPATCRLPTWLRQPLARWRGRGWSPGHGAPTVFQSGAFARGSGTRQAGRHERGHRVRATRWHGGVHLLSILWRERRGMQQQVVFHYLTDNFCQHHPTNACRIEWEYCFIQLPRRHYASEDLRTLSYPHGKGMPSLQTAGACQSLLLYNFRIF